MGLEQSYDVPPPCTTAQCIPPQGANVVYERAYDQYGRPIVVVHQQPPLRTQMNYSNNVAQMQHNPPLQSMYPGYMQTYQSPSHYPVHTTNPYATVSTAQYPGQYAPHPSPGALLTTPGYYYMPASTVQAPTATTVSTVHAPMATNGPTAVQVRPSDSTPTVPAVVLAPHSYPAPLSHTTTTTTLSNTVAAHDSLPVLAPLVSNTDQQRVSNMDSQHVSSNLPNSHVTAAATSSSNHVAVPHVDANNAALYPVTLPGLTPFVSNTDQQQVSNVDSQHVSNTNLEPSAESKSDTLTSVDPEPLVSFSNVTVINNSPLPGIETTFSNEPEAKNSSARTVPQSDTKNVDSPARVKKSFNPLPRRQPTVKAYLAHEEL